MTELILQYLDDFGDEKLITVYGERVFVGRHSESEVYIPDPRLSRRHMRIERFGDTFIASDAGSSNGTLLNGNALTETAVLQDGDVLDLGGLQVNVVLKRSESVNSAPSPPGRDVSIAAGGAAAPQFGEAVSLAEPVNASDAGGTSPSGSGSMLLWILIPVFGIVFIFFAGAILFLVLSGPSTTAAKKQTDDVYTEDDPSPESNKKEASNKKETEDSNLSNSSKTSDSNGVTGPSNSSQTGKLGETAKIEQNGAAFLRKIAHNDPRAFLTTEQAGRLSSKIKQLSGSSAVAENLKSASKNSAQIKSLAESKNLKPQFLAIAAVAKLGGTRGDVLQTAQGMTEVLDKLVTQLGNELADDTLLVIAAYSQGAGGDTMKMRNMLQQLANSSPESSRAIRTIWFLQKNGKITQSEFDNALNFLAVGTIAQNPKDFGVNAEPLTL
jgi:pSer/pThr/pTyr-binding forkhead associated (FHA) protein